MDEIRYFQVDRALFLL